MAHPFIIFIPCSIFSEFIRCSSITEGFSPLNPMFMKRKSPASLVKINKVAKPHSLKNGLANAIEMKLVQIKSNHTSNEIQHSHLSVFRYAQ
jgi:hypothetical protein